MNNCQLAPVCLFVYARAALTRRTVESLLANPEASASELHVFCDGPRPDADARTRAQVQAVRDYVRGITGFARVVLHESAVNLGLSRSVIGGVSEMLRTHERVIVLEDDLVLSSGFLRFMHQALQTYADVPQVLSVSGYAHPIHHRPGPEPAQDATFGLRASSWGWAIWRDRWEQIDWAVTDYPRFRWNLAQRLRFNRGGSDLSHMLDRQMAGKIDSWAIRLCFHQFRHGLVDVFPRQSLVENIGFGEGAAHCRHAVRPPHAVCPSEPPAVFRLPTEVCTDPDVLRQFRGFNSLSARALRTLKRWWLDSLAGRGAAGRPPAGPHATVVAAPRAARPHPLVRHSATG